jgi:hypothetical protein
LGPRLETLPPCIPEDAPKPPGPAITAKFRFSLSLGKSECGWDL